MTSSQRGGAVLAGSDHRSTLAVLRSLAQIGIPVAVVGISPHGAVASSRFARRHARGPSPERDPAGFVRTVHDVAARERARLVIPLNDAALAACVSRRERFADVAALATPTSEAVWSVLDKRRNLELARRLGIPVPRQFELEAVDQVPELADTLGFPVVLKNPGPNTAAGRSLRFRWLVARDERELRSLLHDHCGDGVFPLFQELVTGTVRNVCCFAVEGELVAVHEYVSIRRWNGEGVLRQMTAASPDLVRYAELMLGALRWDGVAHLGFFVGADGAVRYMETNGRFWGSIAGSVRAGWDFPRWTFEYFVEGRRPSTPPLAIGSRTCWHYGDLSALVHFLRGGVAPSSDPVGRLRAVADYLGGFRPGVGSDMFRIDDPLPELVEHWHGLRRVLTRRRHAKLGDYDR